MPNFDFEIVKNPEIFAQNRMDAHSDHRFYASMVEAEAEKESGFTYCLNGLWKFSYAKNYAAAPADFYKKELDCHGWDDIRVPAHIQTEGYDKPQYVNLQYPWDGHEAVKPGEIPMEFNPVASYVKYFEVPESMQDMPVYISFQGVESGFALWLNGEYVGYSEDSFTPSEFDLTPYINYNGENKLAAQVFKWTAGSWCEDQDFFRFSGIFRDVYLYTVPQVHIWDMKVETLVADDFNSAELELTLEASAEGKAKVRLINNILDVIIEKEVALIAGKNELSLEVEEVCLWSAEDPYLYDLTIEISGADGELTEFIKEKVGFRRFEIIDSILTLNGKRIVFKGANRHEFSAIHGRAIPEEDILKDLITMKRNNINAVRTSHYPNKSVFYRYCDELGLYVIDETNMETHGTMQPILCGDATNEYAVPGDRPEYEGLVIDRARSMYQRDKNHACVLIWSLGNESYGGTNFVKMHDAFHEWDPSRPVHYEGVFNDQRYPYTTDIVSTMYVVPDDIRAFLAEHRDRPYISCEYAHAMGNSCGNMFKYTDLTEEEPLYQGGFIWDFIDQSMTKVDRYGVEFQGYGGDFDDRPSDYNFSANGLCHAKDREPSPKLQEVKYLYQNIAITIDKTDEGWKATVQNKHLFTPTWKYNAICELHKDGVLIERVDCSFDVDPLSTKEVVLPLMAPENETEGEYVATLSFVTEFDAIWAKAGHEVAYGQGSYGKFATPNLHKTNKNLTITKGFWNTGVKGDDFEVLFSETAGGLASYVYGGKEVFKTIPKPNFWRAMTENDMANLLPFRAGQWKLASMYNNVKYNNGWSQSPGVLEELDDCVRMTYTYHLPTTPELACDVAYTVYADGTIDVHMELPASAEIGQIPEFSLLMGMDADHENLSWYGPGPEETYADKWHGKLGLHTNKVRDNMAKYIWPQECGNHMDVRFATVTDAKGRGIKVWGESLNLSVLPYTPHELDNATHTNELPPILYTWLRIGQMQMGVAGDNTWGAQTHPEFCIDNSHELVVDFSFKGI